MRLLRSWMLSFLYASIVLCSGCSWIGPHVHPREPGLDDLVIFDPGTHERGLPAVQLRESESGLDVEIPPAVHVHRYYYSGDKEFQAPLIPGGPTIVVANHPKTGQQMKIDVMLPSGAPVIAHSSHSITYVYPDRRVQIAFGRIFKDQASVKLLSGKGSARHWRDSKEKIKEHYHEHVKGSELYSTTRDTVKASGEVLAGGAQTLGTFASQTIQLTSGALNIVPGVATLRGMAEDAAYQRRDAAIRLAEDQKNEAELKYLPTVR